MAVAAFHEFESREALAEQLAREVADRLKTDIERGAFASLALSGGSTPQLFLETLGKRDDWNKAMTYIALVDERYVPTSHERSNEAMIRRSAGLFDHPESEFLSLYRDGLGATAAAHAAEEKLREDEELPFDVVTLGMGTDGHTASFFADANNFAEVVDPSGDRLFAAIQRPGGDEDRITMTLPTIISSDFIALHIEGVEKRAVYEEALRDGPAGELPLRHVLRHADANVHVYWAP